MRFKFVVAVFSFALVACATPAQPGADGVTPTIQVEAGHDFRISVGQEARLTGTSLVVRFRGVNNDSRCPSDVQCVWAGNAVVSVTLSASGHQSLDAALNTTLEPKSVTYAGYTVTLVGLDPQPRSGTSIPQDGYAATLAIQSGPLG